MYHVSLASRGCCSKSHEMWKKLREMLPAIGKESATRASSAAMRVVVQPPPLLPIMITRL